jgi:hypothetical protein
MFQVLIEFDSFDQAVAAYDSPADAVDQPSTRDTVL